MIYETAVVVRPELDENGLNTIKEMVTKTIQEFEGEVLLTDDWGTKHFAQPYASGARIGRYIYFMYRSNTQANKELERKCRINENVLRSLIVRLGEDSHIELCKKSYRRPGTALADANAAEEGGFEEDRKFSSRRRVNWQKVGIDWKDPQTYSWCVNEFGKIAPARVSGLPPKVQRQAMAAIKRGRCLGLLSYLSNNHVR